MTNYKFNTARIHGGYIPEEHQNAAEVPIYQNVAFTLGDAEHAEKIARGNVPNAYTYSRVGNPTVAVLEKRIAILDGGIEAVAVSSGMAAITYSILNVAEGGGRIIAPFDLYGAALDEFKTLFPKYGIEFDLVADINDLAVIKRLIKPETKAIYTESISNPTTKISDVAGLAAVAHQAGVPLIVDNTFPTPYLFQPLKYGADIVLYSSTKGINGHGNAVSGLIVDGGKFNWNNGKFPQFQEKEFILKEVAAKEDYSYAGVFGNAAFIKRIKMKYLRLMGAVLGPFEAYLELLGLETIAERLDKEVATSLKIAHYLKQEPHVKNVYYTGLEDAPQAELRKKYFPKGIGTILSFEIAGTAAQTKKVVDAVKLFLYLPNVGDSRSLIVNPNKITHREVPVEYQAAGHLTDQLLRLSIGLEDSEDLISDLKSAIAQAFEEETDDKNQG
ncbi:O-acetylhomoserine aminocarboxypropyltransferase/cysteine synthase family protein [Liquorilactobacillus satsumensis]|uniref:O-acetylhomoserine aminocarboxypropyltransferase/cysteine synthase family protein n=1 Tax=Liquorilactobacillus satsumensis TaxID=259059 RepID=UPI0039E8A4EC